MRHRKKYTKIGRTSAHRDSMLANMANSLIMHKRINTTVAKAKMLRSYVEPLITRSKTDTTHSRRIVFGYLQNKIAVSELFRDVAVKVGERPGGYTRILHTGNRLGDNADMCMIELVDYNENLLLEKESDKKPERKTRRRRGGKKKTSQQSAQPAEGKQAKDTPEQTPPEKDAAEKSGSNDMIEDAQVIEEDKGKDEKKQVAEDTKEKASKEKEVSAEKKNEDKKESAADDVSEKSAKKDAEAKKDVEAKKDEKKDNSDKGKK